MSDEAGIAAAARSHLEYPAIVFAYCFFAGLAALSFAQVRADPLAALYGAGVPAAVAFFAALRSSRRRR